MTVMIPPGKRRLFQARNELLYARQYLHAVRKETCWGSQRTNDWFLAQATENFYAALDHVWEMQCMVEGRL